MEVISHSTMYWLVMLDNVKETLTQVSIGLSILTWVCTLASFIAWLANADTLYKSDKELSAKARGYFFKCLKCIPILMLFIIVTTLIPTTKQMAAIYLVPKIANNEGVQDVAIEVKELAEDWLNELKPKKEGE